MASRKSSRKRQPSPNPLQTLAENLLRPGTIGAILVLLAVFTLLSLISGSNGSLTGAWIGILQRSFGLGAWLVPVVAGIIGIWLVVSALDNAPTPAWRRPIGVLVLFAGIVIGAGLLLPLELRADPAAQADAGGRLGSEIASALQNTISLVGAWAFVAFLVIAGIIFLTDRLLVDGFARLVGGAQEFASRRREAARHAAINPQVPLPLGEVSIWNRLRARAGLGRKRDDYALPAPGFPGAPGMSTLVRPQPPAASGIRPVTDALTAGAALPGRVLPPPATQATEPTVLQPRIIGGTQEWRLPRVPDMLGDWERRTDSDELIREQGRLIQETLALFGVPADFEGAYKGPSVTQYLIKPGYTEKNIKGEQSRLKVKVAKIAALSNDLALALAAPSVRIEAPIPGTTYVGVEVPNRESNVVGLKELMESESFQLMKGRLKIALGEDVKGQAVTADLSRMPHLLIAGATGSGKSVCINSIITCLLLTHTPDTLRLLMVDPKMVELSVYNGVPHLLSPVVTEVDKAAGVLFWAVKEMERRYTLFTKASARDIIRYNEFLVKKGEKALPYIVVIVDEMADLMMAAPEEVEKHICRLAQMARATGIHLIIATQRPSVDVITGLIKANFPSRIAFAVTSQIDSRVILDIPGAERLLGRGDMLFMAPDAGKLERLQGTYLGDEEINKVVRYWKGVRVVDGGEAGAPWEQARLPIATPDLGEVGTTPAPTTSAPPLFPPAAGTSTPRPVPPSNAPLFEQIEAMKALEGRDTLFDDAVRAVREAGRGSTSLLQRKLRIGYGRASRLIDQLADAGILGEDQGGTGGRPLLENGRPVVPKAPPAATNPSPARHLTPRIIGDEENSNTPPQKPDIWM